MIAAILNSPGRAENLQIVETAIPEPTEGQVLIKVKSFGLNRSELMTRKGLSPNVKFPRILGIECAGEVELDPSGQYTKGQKVMALMGGMGRDFDGSYAEFTILPIDLLLPFHSSLAWEILGAIPEMYQTVHGSLFLALNIHKGETLLIRGATSSIGLLATQVAKNLVVTVIGTSRNPEKKKLVLENGASHFLVEEGTLKDNIQAIFPNGVDKVLELVGALTLKDSLECVRPGGTCCMAGMLSESWSIADFAPMEFIPATVNLTIYDSGQIRSPANVFQEFIDQVEKGYIKVKVSKVFSLTEIAEAHKLMESNRADGKIVVLNA